MRKSVVVAEDNVHLRGLYADALRRESYDVHPAENGKRALEQIAEKRPNLIFLDIMMPHVNGIEVCRSAREIVGQAIPIVMLTALDDIETIEKSIAAGADDYIVKSAGVGTLLTRARFWMSHKTLTNLAARRAAIRVRLREGQSGNDPSGDSLPESPGREPLSPVPIFR